MLSGTTALDWQKAANIACAVRRKYTDWLCDTLRQLRTFVLITGRRGGATELEARG